MADRSIVVGVDGTSTGLRAVAWAAREALLRGRLLRLVHAAPYLGTPDARSIELSPHPPDRPCRDIRAGADTALGVRGLTGR